MSRKRIFSLSKSPCTVSQMFTECVLNWIHCAPCSLLIFHTHLAFCLWLSAEHKLDKWQTRRNCDKWDNKHVVKAVNSSRKELLTVRGRARTVVHYKVWSNPCFFWKHSSRFIITRCKEGLNNVKQVQHCRVESMTASIFKLHHPPVAGKSPLASWDTIKHCSIYIHPKIANHEHKIPHSTLRQWCEMACTLPVS